jgi:predicted HTH transcriptional regulator
MWKIIIYPLSIPFERPEKREKEIFLQKKFCFLSFRVLEIVILYLFHVPNEKMMNQSLRERFKIEEKNYSIASRIIKDTIDANMIKEEDPENKSRKYARYIPFWGQPILS